ncbi:Endonuclease/exonuclease/phosphatase [Bacillus methanolicus PB1]|uniref:Endonuclease/exonuclease/phosphatase n=2 Tax=Bacillus methanolicus TaxID=1471 RepID=I3E1L7_BACMT|nr:Endonuclease/exonuclease/phosphatase [Bacillus methanolicus PB1]
MYGRKYEHGEDIMKKRRQRKHFNIAIIFAVVLSLFAPVNVSKAAEAMTVAQAIANNSGNATVEGYIVGVVKSGSGSSITYAHTGPFTVDTNLALADNPNETDKSKIIPVQLPSGSIRTALNLKDNPANLGKKIQITASLEAYFSVPGLKSPTTYTFVEDTNPTKVQPVTASPAAGAVAAGTTVTLSTATAGAKIYYTTDGSEPTETSTEYTGPITIDKDVTIKAMATANELENSDVQTFTYTILQEQSIADVRKQAIGAQVSTTGIVTAVLKNTVYIQDETAGIVLYGSGLNVKRGDKVRVKGALADFNTLLEINVQASDVQVIGSETVPQPQVLTADQLQEDKEGMLVSVNNVTVESFSNGNYTAKDGNGNTFVIRPEDTSLLSVNKTYTSITGVLGAYKNTYQLIPRDAADIISDSNKVQAIAATPGSGLVKKGETVTLSTATEGATIYYTTDNSEPTTNSLVYNGPIPITENTTLKAVAVKDGFKNSDIATFQYIIQDGEIRIHDIQGIGHTSPLDGKNVSDIEGIVTFVVDSDNLYMQDLQPDHDDKTSEGILVYKKSHGVNVGDVVKVSGQVKEYVLEGYAEKLQTDLPVTEINASSGSITKVSSGQPLPAPIVIGKDRTLPTEIIDNDSFTKFDPEEDGIDFFESLEGMLVQVDHPKVVAPQKYGEVIVVPEAIPTNTIAGGLKISETDYNPERIMIDINDENFVAKTGDHFNGSIKGVVSYSFSNYKVLSKKADLPPLIEGATARETTTITRDPEKLTIASYNVENFSAETDDAKATKLAQAIVENLKQPDIIGLSEMQDNDGETDSGNTNADQSFAKLINKIKELGGPEYAYTDIAPENNKDGGAPGGNIRVGFLYKKEQVSLMEAPKGTATQAVGFENGKLTLNPGRIDPTNPAFDSSRKPLAAQFEFNGKSVIVVANHFNSKGGDLPLFGKVQPPVLTSEAKRLEIARIVNNFVKDIKSKDPNANIVVLGDFNDFEFSNPLKTLKGNELTNMIEKVPAEERYSYTYQGNSQVLDHILVSNNLAQSTIVDIVHINSSFMEEHGRASDHDPVIIQTQLGTAQPKYDKIYNLVGFSTKKLTVQTANSLINMDSTSVIREGIWLKNSATVKGEGLKNTKIIISPTSKDAVIDLSGVEVKEVLIDNANVKEIRGAENVQLWTVTNGVDTSNIIFKDSKGEVITSPFLYMKQKEAVS